MRTNNIDFYGDLRKKYVYFNNLQITSLSSLHGT